MKRVGEESERYLNKQDDAVHFFNSFILPNYTCTLIFLLGNYSQNQPYNLMADRNICRKTELQLFFFFGVRPQERHTFKKTFYFFGVHYGAPIGAIK